ncbi:DNA primase small subunit isoform X2 [Ctenocephalides felis]|uniref:DNA primase small subunit isoform X2 n=1 Tax=Ctenocephalides felis TaxID=7515 RepID=UPI000E6E3FCA|nr:DNA primase small subunit isoform X2 [Ctenocephalides felis]
METENKCADSYNPETLLDLLPLYYKRLFPHLPFYRWLSYDGGQVFTHREFSFTLVDDVYIRYLSFETQEELEKELYSKNPVKIDIGPVLNIKPKDHRSVRTITPVQRELVFDIDLTDYDDVRTCCSGASVCPKCWKYMAIACKILDAALREDFGFEHLLWIFSGRRGIHCWVCDKEARLLDNKGRSAIAEYLTLISGSEGTAKRMTVGDKMHHSVKRALKMIEPVFKEICLEEQDVLSTPEGLNKLLNLIPDEAVKLNMQLELSKKETSLDRWNVFVSYVESCRIQGNPVYKRMRYIVEEVQVYFVYPRLDANVTKGMGHLLKAPFCVHPKTGKICTPFNPRNVDKFDPTTVPTINQLLDDINAFDEKNSSVENDTVSQKPRIKDYKKTSAYKGIVVFEEFLRKLETSLKSIKQEARDIKMEF